MSDKKILINCSGDKSFNGSLLRALRTGKPYSKHVKIARGHMSKAQIARRIGVSDRQVGRYEQLNDSTDNQQPRLEKLKAICLLFQIDPKYFLGLEWVDEEILVDERPVIDPTLKLEIDKIFCNKCKQLIIDNEEKKNQYIKDSTSKIKRMGTRKKPKSPEKIDATTLLLKKKNNVTDAMELLKGRNKNNNAIDATKLLERISK